MKVSFVIPTLNAGSNLSRVVNSIRSLEALPSHEILIVDNGSTDDSLSSLGSDGRVRIVHESRRGAASARNKGMKEARGEILAFVDSDVTLRSNWASVCLAELEKPYVDCVQTPIEPVGPDDDFMTNYRRSAISSKTSGRFSHLIHARETLPIVNSSAFMLKREVVTRTGCRYDPDLVRCEDLDFSLQLFASGCHFSLIESSRAYVTDDRSFAGYLTRSFKNGMYTDLVRRLWGFPVGQSSSSSVGVAGMWARLDRVVTRSGTYVGFLAKTESRVERKIKKDPRRLKFGTRELAPKDRLVRLPEVAIVIELERGSRVVIEER